MVPSKEIPWTPATPPLHPTDAERPDGLRLIRSENTGPDPRGRMAQTYLLLSYDDFDQVIRHRGISTDANVD